MKTLVLANHKGGVTKSTQVVQLALYLVSLGYRVNVLDLDHQGNATRALDMSGKAAHVQGGASSALTGNDLLKEATSWPDSSLTVAAADREALLALERRSDEHNAFASRFRESLASMADHVDVCIVDTNPNPDIRLLAALVSATHVLAPVQLNQEALDGIGALLNAPRVGIRRVQARLNPDLVLIGAVPTLFESTPFQKTNLTALVAAHGDLIVRTADGTPAVIRRSTAWPEAQAAGLSLAELARTKTSAREAWKQAQPVFDAIVGALELPDVEKAEKPETAGELAE